MVSRAVRTILVSALLCSAAPAQGRPGEELAVVSSHIARGRFHQARRELRELLDAPDPSEPGPGPAVVSGARVLLARIHLMEGRLEEGLAEIGRALASLPEDPDALVVRGDLLMEKGDYPAARAAFARAADAGRLEARFKRGLAVWTLGARKEAEAIWREAADRAENRAYARPSELLFLGRTLERLGRLEEASDLYLEAARKDPLDHRAPVALGDLYFRVYGEVERYPSGAGEYQRVLRPDQGDPGYVPALLGLFRIYRFNLFRDPARTEGFLTRGLERNPGNPEALALLAAWRIEDRRYAEARAALEKALQRNPNHLPALAELHALESLTGREAEAEAARRKALAVHPGHPGPDTALGLHLMRHYRFPEAEAPLRRGLQLDPRSVEALEALGKALIYTGRGREGREHLERAAALEEGFVNAWRTNAILVEKRLQEEYRSYPSGPFQFWLHPLDAPVLLHFLPALYQRARDSLHARYGESPAGPVRVEVFREFGDFSVRTVGFTGFGALGACFGPMITAVSPAAPELKGKFSWAVTAWHEYAHTVTLGLSRQRIPRWLTEGISVHEESVCHPGHGRHMERDLVDALHNGALPRVLRFDTEFRGPQVLFAYYLSGLAVRMLIEAHGLPAVVRMCRLYGEGRETAEALAQAVGWTPDQFDRRFEAWLKRQTATLKIRPRVFPALEERSRARILADPADVAARLELAWAGYFQGRTVDAGQELAALLELEPGLPEAALLRGRLAFAAGNRASALESLEGAFAAGADDFFGRLELAQFLTQERRIDRALEQLEAAHACWPTCAEPQLSPLLRRATLFREAGQVEQANQELARLVAFAGDAREPRLILAAERAKAGDRAGQARLLREALEIDPFDSASLEELALAQEALGSREEALGTLSAALEVPRDLDAARAEEDARPGPEEEAAVEARLRAARAALLFDLDRREEARREAQRALRAAPESPGGRRAQGLLQKLGPS